MNYIKEKEIIRDLAKKIRELSCLEIQRENKENWRNLNELKSKKVMLYVWEEELPWGEFLNDDEMKLETQSPFYRKQELMLKKKLFMWNHFRGDMVLEDCITVAPLYVDTMFGILELGNNIRYSDDVIYYRYINQINSYSDVEKIKLPNIIWNQQENVEYEEKLIDLYRDVLDVNVGITRHNFSAWHFIVKWLGMDRFYDLVINDKKLLHMLIQRVSKGYFGRIQQFEEKKLIVNNNGNYTCGSAGLSYVGDKNRENAINTWGSATAQVFHDVSPEIQEELAINYEREWLKQFEYTCYGCCEDLSNKIDKLKKIENLRKISISPWAALDKSVEVINKEYVISFKINPSIFALPTWDLAEQRNLFKKQLQTLKNCNVEIIVKDNSTLCKDKNRLEQWLKMATEEINVL